MGKERNATIPAGEIETVRQKKVYLRMAQHRRRGFERDHSREGEHRC